MKTMHTRHIALIGLTVLVSTVTLHAEDESNTNASKRRITVPTEEQTIKLTPGNYILTQSVDSNSSYPYAIRVIIEESSDGFIMSPKDSNIQLEPMKLSITDKMIHFQSTITSGGYVTTSVYTAMRNQDSIRGDFFKIVGLAGKPVIGRFSLSGD